MSGPQLREGQVENGPQRIVAIKQRRQMIQTKPNMEDWMGIQESQASKQKCKRTDKNDIENKE